MKKLTVLFFLVLTFAAAAIAQPSDKNALYALFDAEWEYGLKQNPTSASYLGDKRYNNKWSDRSLAAIEKRR